MSAYLLQGCRFNIVDDVFYLTTSSSVVSFVTSSVTIASITQPKQGRYTLKKKNLLWKCT